MATLPLVSIIVPVFNGEPYLRQSLNSIFGQTYPNLEVLVMDDLSTDGTPATIASYGERVRYVRQPSRRGIYGNANDGIGQSRGDLVAVYHADDVYDPRIVEREVAFLQEHPEVGAVFAKDVFIDAQGREFGKLELPPSIPAGQPLSYDVVLNGILTYKNRFLVCPTAMVRRAVYDDVGVYRDKAYAIASDLEMWLRIARRYPLAILDDYLLRYRRGHGSSSDHYYRLRTEPERHFGIMDRYLVEGDAALATPAALVAYEGWRAEDRLMLAVNHYILGRRREALAILRRVRPGQILGSPQVQRGRLLVLYLALHALVRAPRVRQVADAFFRRWHGDPSRWTRDQPKGLGSAGQPLNAA